MNEDVVKKLLEKMNNNSNYKEVDNSHFKGTTKLNPLDNVLTIEKQDIFLKQDFLFRGDFKGNHLEFTFPVKGNVELEINEKYMHSKADMDLFSLSAFEHDRSMIFAKKGDTIKHLAINLNRDIYYKNFHLTKSLTKGNTNLYKVSGDDKYIRETVNKLYMEDSQDNLSKEETRTLAYDLIGYCVNKILGNTYYYRCINKDDLRIISQIRQYINKNFLKKLSLYEISSFSYFNEFKIKKAYKEVYGETVFETIRKKRMDYAVTLISAKKYSLNEIAYLCGYESYPSFYKSFKRHFSFSPSDF